jgi:hypothetical protein
VWVVTRDGFFSAVEERGTGMVLVRCRAREHAAVLRALTGAEDRVVDMPEADYRFRLTVTRRQWADYLATAAFEIDYDSHFKEVVRDNQPRRLRRPMYEAMMGCWTALARVQPTRPYSGLAWDQPRTARRKVAAFDFGDAP